MIRTLLPPVALATFALATCALSPAQNERPNIVFLLADDLGWNDVGYHGSPIRTPHIDALVRGGVELDQHYVQPQCTPTRVALMTGRYPSRFGPHATAASNEQSFPIGTLTLALALQKSGYATAMTGKWHMGSKPEQGPNHHGFDHSHGSYAGAVGMYDHRYRLRSPFAKTWHRNHEWLEEKGHVTDLSMREAVRWIEKKRDKPFFLYVPFHAVHTPLVEEERWLAKAKHIARADRRLYAAAVAHLDAAIGGIVGALERTGQLESTIIIFSSDNGAQVNHSGGAYPPPDPRLRNFSSNAPLRGRKTQAYEGGIRVPAFVHWKGRLAPRKVSAPLHVVDWLPTLARLAGAPLPAKHLRDGRDVWSALQGEPQAPRRLYWNQGNGTWLAMRDGDLKIVRRGERTELFDLAADPNERRDLAGTQPEVLARLEALLAAERRQDAPGRPRVPGPFQATGFKVGEVTATTAIVWTRLTEKRQRNPEDAPMVRIEVVPGKGPQKRRKVVRVVYPDGASVRTIRNAAPGRAGEVRVSYRKGNRAEWRAGEWIAVDPEQDFTRQVTLTDLAPATRYQVRVETRAGPGGPRGQTRRGRFMTAPAATAPARVVFTVSTGQGYRSRDTARGYKIYPSMLKLDPSFFVHTGDIVYYDELAKNIALAHYHWQRTYSLPTNVAFHRQVASYFMKDDHDTWFDDCWPAQKRNNMGEFTFADGVRLFPQQVPMGERTYRTRRWGKDLQVWLVEGRDFRSPNRAPDGPEKTIWGAAQKAWLERTMKASDATFRVLISPTPIVGPDRKNKRDNHSNAAFAHEGNEVRRFLAALKNTFVVCGDRHWQYHSVDPKTELREYSCGPVSDEHSGGWKKDDFRKDYHRYLRVAGGFLSVTVEREQGVPTIAFRFHDVDGKVHFEDVVTGG